MNTETPCLCGSDKPSSQCCELYISGTAIAPTAEALMRSRYVAYATNNEEYILKTWIESTRPTDQSPCSDNVEWVGLQILNTEQGTEKDSSGVVEFRARCRVNGESGGIDERSEFVRENGQWFYVDGSSIKPVRTRDSRVGRNEACPCGSGKKYKKCCGK